MPQARILVPYNQPTLEPSHPDAAAEREVVELALAVADILTTAGYRASAFAISSDISPLLRTLMENRPDAIFNLFEGPAGQGETEAYAIGLYEWLGIPYTGCSYDAVVLARDKPRAKLLLQAAGLPTPAFFVLEKLPVPRCSLKWPVIAKPAIEDASVGIDQESVVVNDKQLRQRVGLLFERYQQPVLVEEFIDGRELNVAVVDSPDRRILPISEIVFSGQDTGRWPIVTYEAKWSPGSAEDRATTPRCPAEVSIGLAERLGQIALEAFQLFRCRDYARIDFRVDPSGEPYILEVNPNPDFAIDAGLARSLKAAGLTHRQFTLQLVRQALERGGRLTA